MSAKKMEWKMAFTELESESEMSGEEKSLLNAARKAAASAYAPYSNFYVGAALLLANGETVTGNNQENAAYPSGLCAERVAAFAASARYPGIRINTLVVTCRSSKSPVHEPLSPCGACRQVLHEYEKLQGHPIKIILTGESGKVWLVDSVNDLLPLAFDGSKLKK